MTDDQDDALMRWATTAPIRRRSVVTAPLKAGAAVLVGSWLASFLAACGRSTTTPQPTPKPTKTTGIDPTRQYWGACFDQGDSHTLTTNQLQGWNLLVLDPDDVRDSGMDMSKIPSTTTKLAYVDVSEIEAYRGDFEDFRKAGVLMVVNQEQSDPTDPTSYHWIADIRSPQYYDLMKKRIQGILSQTDSDGHPLYNGIMLDAMDTSLAMTKGPNDDDFGQTGGYQSLLSTDDQNRLGSTLNDPNFKAQFKQAAIDLVRKLRADFPDKKIMVNRAFDITRDLAEPVVTVNGQKRPAIDSIMAESTITDSTPKDGADGTYGYSDGVNSYKFWSGDFLEEGQQVDQSGKVAYQKIHQMLGDIKDRIPVYAMDYWRHEELSQDNGTTVHTEGSVVSDPDAAIIEQIAKAQRALGYCSFVTTDDKEILYAPDGKEYTRPQQHPQLTSNVAAIG